jgi:hypothetical protein
MQGSKNDFVLLSVLESLWQKKINKEIKYKCATQGTMKSITKVD